MRLHACKVLPSYSRSREALLKLPPAKSTTQRPRWKMQTEAPTSSLSERAREQLHWQLCAAKENAGVGGELNLLAIFRSKTVRTRSQP